MPRKTGEDKMPLDLKGEMMFLGSIVVVGVTVLIEGLQESTHLHLGYVSKITQKNGVDVTIFFGANNYAESGEHLTETRRFKKPAHEILIVPVESLKTRDKFHEAIRYAAATASNNY